MDQFSLLQKIILYAIPIIFAITVHETAHGWVASKLGDQTAKLMGRLTLNPIKHIDLIGTILVPAILIAIGGFIFGWAKPVPVTWQNLRNPRRDVALVALAGPGANLLMALIWGGLAKLGAVLVLNGMPLAGEPIYDMGLIGIFMNLILMMLNLIPIPPLDGSRVVSAFLRGRAAYYYGRIEPYGFFILLALIAFGALGKFLNPVVLQLQALIGSLFGLGG
ncbi:MAG: site-2 protease family protein [Gammaproteobacteria bacterium]|nr:site-2 protease family protein [Gammaproteobacteria bacterium]